MVMGVVTPGTCGVHSIRDEVDFFFFFFFFEGVRGSCRRGGGGVKILCRRHFMT